MINELPYKMRIRTENVIVAALWIGLQKPSANLFTDRFKKQLEELYKYVDFVTTSTINPLRVRDLTISGKL